MLGGEREWQGRVGGSFYKVERRREREREKPRVGFDGGIYEMDQRVKNRPIYPCTLNLFSVSASKKLPVAPLTWQKRGMLFTP